MLMELFIFICVVLFVALKIQEDFGKLEFFQLVLLKKEKDDGRWSWQLSATCSVTSQKNIHLLPQEVQGINRRFYTIFVTSESILE